MRTLGENMSELIIFCFTDLSTGGFQQEARENEQETHQLCSHPKAEQSQPDGEGLQGWKVFYLYFILRLLPHHRSVPQVWLHSEVSAAAADDICVSGLQLMLFSCNAQGVCVCVC